MTTALPPNFRVGAISARQGAANALAEVLLTMRANADGGTDADRTIALAKVLTRWPRRGELVPPIASVSDVTVQGDEDDLDAAWLDGSFIPELGAALKTTETSGVFAVDVWTADDVERQAVEAALSALFCSGDESDPTAGETSLVRPLPQLAIPRAWRGRSDLGLHVRLTLRKQPVPIDDAGLVSDDEYRAHAEVEWDAPKVTAAIVGTLDVIANRGAITDPTTKEDEED